MVFGYLTTSAGRNKPVYSVPNDLKPSLSWQKAEKHARDWRMDYWERRCSVHPDSSACKVFDE